MSQMGCRSVVCGRDKVGPISSLFHFSVKYRSQYNELIVQASLEQSEVPVEFSHRVNA